MSQWVTARSRQKSSGLSEQITRADYRAKEFRNTEVPVWTSLAVHCTRERMSKKEILVWAQLGSVNK